MNPKAYFDALPEALQTLILGFLVLFSAYMGFDAVFTEAPESPAQVETVE